MNYLFKGDWYGAKIGIIAAGMAIAFGFLVPTALSPFVVDNCRPDDWDNRMMVCDPIRPWISGAQFVLGTVGFLMSPLWLGVVFGLIWATWSNKGFWQTFIKVVIASLTMLAVFMLFEVLWYRPWITEPYNRFELNRLFTTVVAVLVPFSALFGYVMTVSFSKRLWRAFQSPKTLSAKK